MYTLKRNTLFAFAELLKFIFFGKGLFMFPNPQISIFASSKYISTTTF